MSNNLVERVAQQFSYLDHLSYEYGKRHTWNDYARAAIAVVLEEAAKVAAEKADNDPMDDFDNGWTAACADIAAAIRAMVKHG